MKDLDFFKWEDPGEYFRLFDLKDDPEFQNGHYKESQYLTWALYGALPERRLQKAIDAFAKNADAEKLGQAFNQTVHVTNGQVVYEAKIDGPVAVKKLLALGTEHLPKVIDDAIDEALRHCKIYSVREYCYGPMWEEIQYQKYRDAPLEELTFRLTIQENLFDPALIEWPDRYERLDSYTKRYAGELLYKDRVIVQSPVDVTCSRGERDCSIVSIPGAARFVDGHDLDYHEDRELFNCLDNHIDRYVAEHEKALEADCRKEARAFFAQLPKQRVIPKPTIVGEFIDEKGERRIAQLVEIKPEDGMDIDEVLDALQLFQLPRFDDFYDLKKEEANPRFYKKTSEAMAEALTYAAVTDGQNVLYAREPQEVDTQNYTTAVIDALEQGRLGRVKTRLMNPQTIQKARSQSR